MPCNLLPEPAPKGPWMDPRKGPKMGPFCAIKKRHFGSKNDGFPLVLKAKTRNPLSWNLESHEIKCTWYITPRATDSFILEGLLRKLALSVIHRAQTDFIWLGSSTLMLWGASCRPGRPVWPIFWKISSQNPKTSFLRASKAGPSTSVDTSLQKLES